MHSTPIIETVVKVEAEIRNLAMSGFSAGITFR